MCYWFEGSRKLREYPVWQRRIDLHTKDWWRACCHAKRLLWLSCPGKSEIESSAITCTGVIRSGGWWHFTGVGGFGIVPFLKKIKPSYQHPAWSLMRFDIGGRMTVVLHFVPSGFFPFTGFTSNWTTDSCIAQNGWENPCTGSDFLRNFTSSFKKPVKPSFSVPAENPPNYSPVCQNEAVLHLIW